MQRKRQQTLQLAEGRCLAASGRGKAIRLAARLSLVDVGRGANTSHVNVLRWEGGARRPTGAAGARWAALLRALEERGFEPDEAS